MLRHIGGELIRAGRTAVGRQEVRNSSAICRLLKRSLQAGIGLYLIIKLFSTHFPILIY